METYEIKKGCVLNEDESEKNLCVFSRREAQGADHEL